MVESGGRMGEFTPRDRQVKSDNLGKIGLGKRFAGI